LSVANLALAAAVALDTVPSAHAAWNRANGWRRAGQFGFRAGR